jgi:tetratricopeptide (TPR) repeat protein
VVNILSSLANSGNTDILMLLGKAYIQLQNYVQAIECFEKALAAGGEILEVLNALGYCCLKTHDINKAKKYFERSLQINPQQTNIKQLLQKLKD